MFVTLGSSDIRKLFAKTLQKDSASYISINSHDYEQADKNKQREVQVLNMQRLFCLYFRLQENHCNNATEDIVLCCFQKSWEAGKRHI